MAKYVGMVPEGYEPDHSFRNDEATVASIDYELIIKCRGSLSKVKTYMLSGQLEKRFARMNMRWILEEYIKEIQISVLFSDFSSCNLVSRYALWSKRALDLVDELTKTNVFDVIEYEFHSLDTTGKPEWKFADKEMVWGNSYRSESALIEDEDYEDMWSHR